MDLTFEDTASPLARALDILDMQASALDALRLELVEIRGERDGLRYALEQLTEGSLKGRIVVTERRAPRPVATEPFGTRGGPRWYRLPIEERKATLVQALRESMGRAGLAARKLEVERSTLLRAAKHLEIDVDSFREVFDTRDCWDCGNSFDIYAKRTKAHYCPACRHARTSGPPAQRRQSVA